MAQTTQQELNNIKNDIRAIIAQISSVSNEMRGIKGLGAEKCTQKLDQMVRKYRTKLNMLERINLNSEMQSGGAGSSRSF